MPVIGEAARHISDEFREEHPEIPWLQIIGQRNAHAHEYRVIMVERGWLTDTKSLPELLMLLNQLIPEGEE